MPSSARNCSDKRSSRSLRDVLGSSGSATGPARRRLHSRSSGTANLSTSISIPRRRQGRDGDARPAAEARQVRGNTMKRTYRFIEQPCWSRACRRPACPTADEERWSSCWTWTPVRRRELSMLRGQPPQGGVDDDFVPPGKESQRDVARAASKDHLFVAVVGIIDRGGQQL